MLQKSKYVYEGSSFDNEYGLLYNSKNDYFIRYSKSDFENFDTLCNFPEIQQFLSGKDFFESESELEELKKIHETTLKSEDTLMLIIKITKDCNFRCVYCYEKFEDKKISTDLENGIVSFIKNKLALNKVKHVIISWFGGEPLLNLECIERMSLNIIDLCSRYNVKYSSSVVTNGYLLNAETISKLLNLKINTFQVTIDGPAYIHNCQRKHKNGINTFNTIKDNLISLKNMDGKFNVVLRTNISPELVKCMDDYENDLLLNFVDDARFLAMYHPVVDFSDCSHLVSDSDVLNLIIHSIKKGIKFAPLIGYLSSTESFCYAIKDNRYVIDVDGNVSKCTVVDADYSIVGNITKDGELLLNKNNDLWLNSRLSPKCNNCKSFASCGGGACPLYYLKHSVSRCMKYKDEKEKDEILKITELQGAYNLTLSLK